MLKISATIVARTLRFFVENLTVVPGGRAAIHTFYLPQNTIYFTIYYRMTVIKSIINRHNKSRSTFSIWLRDSKSLTIRLLGKCLFACRSWSRGRAEHAGSTLTDWISPSSLPSHRECACISVYVLVSVELHKMLASVVCSTPRRGCVQCCPYRHLCVGSGIWFWNRKYLTSY